MAIHIGSRYQASVIDNFYDVNKNTLIPMISRRQLSQALINIPASDYTTRVWEIHDRIDNVAYEEYEDSGFWWAIMDANPKYLTPYDIQVGDTIIIPPYEAIREALGNG